MYYSNAAPISPQAAWRSISGKYRGLTIRSDQQTIAPMPPVLLVDDDVAVRGTIARFLTFEGFAVVEANNGLEALTYLRTGAGASVILLDLRMPVMDGWTFRREQRLDPELKKIPVVVLSGADADRFPELEAAETFEKPVRMSQVVSAVRRLSDRSLPR